MEQALAQLKDIHLPEPIGFWPLAPLWYIVILLACLGLGFYCYRRYRRYLKLRAQKQALIILKDIETEFNVKGDVVVTLTALSALLRRTAMAYFPRENVAGLYGSAWVMFLGGEPWAAQLDNLPYQKSPAIDSMHEIFKSVNAWLKDIPYV